MEQAHDKDCPGCATDREMKRGRDVAFVRDYLAYCDACRGSIQGDTEHRVNGATYHRGCVPADAAAPTTHEG